MIKQNNEWKFSALGDYGYLKTDQGFASVTKIDQWSWRWEIERDGELVVDMDGWWGIAASAEEAMFYAESKL